MIQLIGHLFCVCDRVQSPAPQQLNLVTHNHIHNSQEVKGVDSEIHSYPRCTESSEPD